MVEWLNCMSRPTNAAPWTQVQTQAAPWTQVQTQEPNRQDSTFEVALWEVRWPPSLGARPQRRKRDWDRKSDPSEGGVPRRDLKIISHFCYLKSYQAAEIMICTGIPYPLEVLEQFRKNDVRTPFRTWQFLMPFASRASALLRPTWNSLTLPAQRTEVEKTTPNPALSAPWRFGPCSLKPLNTKSRATCKDFCPLSLYPSG